MSSKPRFWTTRISAGQTASEIGEMVRRYGCRRYMVDWDDDGDPVALQFWMQAPEVETLIPVSLRAQTDAIARRLGNGDTARAKRIAWRQLKAWVEMSLEMAENGVKPFHELFMADVVLPAGKTVGEMFKDQAPLFLTAGDD